MRVQTKAECREVARSLQGFDVDGLKRLGELYRQRGEVVLASLVEAEVRRRQAGSAVLPLGNMGLFE